MVSRRATDSRRPPVAETDGPTARVDGRVARRERTQDAIVDAIIELIEGGDAQPSMAEVAAWAGVSERSIFRHFDSRDALLGAVIDRQMEAISGLLHEIEPTGTLAARADALMTERARLFEHITPMRRAALRAAEDAPIVADQLAALRAWLRDELEQVFGRELSRRDLAERRDLLDAVDMATSWEAWNVLRAMEGCSVARARRIVSRVLVRTLSGG